MLKVILRKDEIGWDWEKGFTSRWISELFWS